MLLLNLDERQFTESISFPRVVGLEFSGAVLSCLGVGSEVIQIVAFFTLFGAKR